MRPLIKESSRDLKPTEADAVEAVRRRRLAQLEEEAAAEKKKQKLLQDQTPI
jgi:hypothetical protein